MYGYWIGWVFRDRGRKRAGQEQGWRRGQGQRKGQSDGIRNRMGKGSNNDETYGCFGAIIQSCGKIAVLYIHIQKFKAKH